MDFANQRYVRLYVSDTVTWKRLQWDGQTMLMHLLRKADRAGVIDIGELPPWEAAVMLCGAPEEQARRGVAKALELGCIVHGAGRLVFPRFIEANDAAMSNKQRLKESRAKRADLTRIASAPTQTESQPTRVDTARHAATHGDTPRPANNGINGHGGLSLRAIGHTWYAETFGRDDYPSGGKWDLAYEQIGAKPAAEKRDVARTIQSRLGKRDARRIMTPRHIADYWVGFAEGKPPGDFARPGDAVVQPGAAEVAAAKSASDAAYASYRAAIDEESKTRLRARWLESDTQLKALKAKYSWTG